MSYSIYILLFYKYFIKKIIMSNLVFILFDDGTHILRVYMDLQIKSFFLHGLI